jgi:hypothetical protein
MDLGFNITIVFSHIIPAILGFLAILCLINGMFDKNRYIIIIGVGMFVLAAIIPFIIIPFLI